MSPPFKTDCKVVRKDFEIDYIVYRTGKFDVDFDYYQKFERLTQVERTLACKENYRELKEWISENW